MSSPYAGLEPPAWEAKTRELIAAHPLQLEVIKDVVLVAWEGIFSSEIGLAKARIGRDVFFSP